MAKRTSPSASISVVEAQSPAKLVGQDGIDQAGGVLLVLHQLHGAAHVLFDVVGDIPAGETPVLTRASLGW